MKASEIKSAILSGALEKYSHLYSDIEAETERFVSAIDAFSEKYGVERDISVLSVPGRSEIIGNHTDHQCGKVIAGAITRDIIAVVSANNDGVIRFFSEGYEPDRINLSEVANPEAFKSFTSRALVAGMVQGFKNNGYNIGGFDAYSITEVLKGSGLSSSAAFEVMIGNILNYLYNGGRVDNKEIAKIAQFSENVYFGKPSGLMDQMACAVGGFVYIDFKDKDNPTVEPIVLDVSGAGYSLCIVNTGGSHANLNDDYASVPAEMRAAAAVLGKELLADTSEEEIIARASEIRKSAGDRALLRAIHLVRENKRVEEAREALMAGDIDAFFDCLIRSGLSSFKYLQNVYTNQNPKEQGLSVALALADGYLSGKGGSHRVHGGGFAGTIQAFVKTEELDGFVRLMDSVFGEGAAIPLSVRPVGATKLF